MIIETQLSTIKKHLQSYLNYTFKELNIKSSEMIFLKVLEKIGKTSQSQLSKHLECDKSHIHRITNKLLGKQFIQFADSQSQPRNNILQITPQGKIIINKVKIAMKLWKEKIIKGIDKQELVAFNSVMQKITHNATQIKLEKENG